MKTDRAALFWGTVIGVALVALVGLGVRFPILRVVFTMKDGDASVAGAGLLVWLTSCYRQIWKRPGFWVLLSAFVAMYWSVLAYMAEHLGGFQMDAFCGIAAGVEFSVFALIIVRVYHHGPQIPSWLK